MNPLLLALIAVVLYLASSCNREDGLPDPPIQTLLPCVPDAAADNPLACPTPPDGPTDGGSPD